MSAIDMADKRQVFGPHGETEPLDLMDNEMHAGDPWPLYTWLREEAPVYKDANGIWWVSRYDDVAHVAMNPELFTSQEGNRPLLPPDESFIHLDGGHHRERRGLVQKYFTPAAVRKREGHVRACITELLDAVIDKGSCDFVADVAAQLPLRLICEMTGIPPEEYATVHHALDVFVKGGQGPDFVTDELNESFIIWGGLHMMLSDDRRENPKDDFITMWNNARVGGEPMNEDTILWEHTMMIVGGAETTRNAISGGLYALWCHPEQRQKLIDGTADFGNAAEEIIRWTTPFVSMSRTLTKDTVFQGHAMKKGEEIVMLYPPANRDPRKFDNPDVFDIEREFTNRVMSFGIGKHVCVGAHLARLETKLMLEEMIKRMPDWAPDGEPTWARSNFLRGMSSFPMKWTPPKGA